jgi:hypothetical protein
MKLFKFGFAALICTLVISAQANAGAYIGALGGYGVASGTPNFTGGGLALGATAGFQLVPNLGVAATYIHDALKSGSTDVAVSQYLVEGNFFSVLFFPSGVHIGNISTSANGSSFSDFGFGAHTGFDLMLTGSISVGAAAYWTYVTTTNDKHSLFNVLIPVKFHL